LSRQLSLPGSMLNAFHQDCFSTSASIFYPVMFDRKKIKVSAFRRGGIRWL